MAIPSIPSNFYVQEANQETLCTWDIVGGATSYDVQRSTDGVIFASVATPSVNSFLDTTVVVGTLYYYQVASVNISGTSGYTSPQQIVPAPIGDMSLAGIRLAAQQRADRVGSNFVTMPEWNTYINLALYELYDLLTTVYEDYFLAPRARFTTTGNTTGIYPLPDGNITFTDISGNSFVAPPFYKLSGVDLALNTSQNAFVTVKKYNLIDRNRYVYPNATSTIYGVYNLQYRVMGGNIEFIPVPSGNQTIQLLYIPRLRSLLQDTDISTLGYSGWLQYAIVRAAKYALDKEESDTTKLDAELIFLKGRIEETAQNRDAGRPDTISDVRVGGTGDGGWNSGFQGGGW